MTKFLTDRVRKVAPEKVSETRYKFLKLAEAEPDLGIAPANNSLLTSDETGNRYWLQLGNGIDLDGISIVGSEDSFFIDTSSIINSSSNTLASVLNDLDNAISDSAIVANNAINSVATDDTLDGDGNIETPLSVLKWATPITVTLSGDASGSASIDGSNNVTIEVTSTTPQIGDIITITKSLTLDDDWQDVGISGDDLQTGSYAIQLFANDVGSGGLNTNEYYTGFMSWFSGSTAESLELPNDEIVLHRAGGGSDAGLYLRTLRSDVLRLQIYSNIANVNASNYVFKFRRIV